MPLSSFLRLAELLRVKHATLHGTLRCICAQVAALETLVRVASGPEAGLLGSGWVTILRCLSLLEALQVRPPAQSNLIALAELACCTVPILQMLLHNGCECCPQRVIPLQSGLPVVPRDAAPKPPPSRQASVAQAAAPQRDAAAAGGAAPEQAEADGPLQRGQSRAPRATGLGRFLSRMGMASETVAPEVSLVAVRCLLK